MYPCINIGRDQEVKHVVTYPDYSQGMEGAVDRTEITIIINT